MADKFDKIFPTIVQKNLQGIVDGSDDSKIVAIFI